MNLRPVIDYFEQTVRPTVDEFYADEMNMRRGRIAAIVLYHVYDYAKSGRDADLVVVVDCQIPTDDLVVHFL